MFPRPQSSGVFADFYFTHSKFCQHLIQPNYRQTSMTTGVPSRINTLGCSDNHLTQIILYNQSDQDIYSIAMSGVRPRFYPSHYGRSKRAPGILAPIRTVPRTADMHEIAWIVDLLTTDIDKGHTRIKIRFIHRHSSSPFTQNIFENIRTSQPFLLQSLISPPQNAYSTSFRHHFHHG